MEHNSCSGACESGTGFFLSRLPRFSKRDKWRSQLPQIASAASLIETFHLPLREIEDKFTKSELILTAWHSQETVHRIEAGLPMEPDRKPPVSRDLPERYFNTEGDLDLRNVSGADAINYLRSIGWAYTNA